MAVVGFHKLEDLFRKGASLDIKKGDAKDNTDIVDSKLQDLLIMGKVTASYNARDLIWKYDLPITKGLDETIDEYKKLDEQIELSDILESIAKYEANYELEIELEKDLVNIVGGLTLVLAKTMKALNEEKRAVSKELIQRASKVMDLTL